MEPLRRIPFGVVVALLFASGHAQAQVCSPPAFDRIDYAISGSSVELGDVDRDGDTDVAMRRSPGVAVLFNDGRGTLTLGATFAAGNIVASGLVLGRFNADAHLDVALNSADVGSPRVSVLQNQGAGTFAPPSLYSVGGACGSGNHGIASGNLDGVGGDDIVAVIAGSDGDRFSSHPVAVLLNNAAGFAPYVWYPCGGFFPQAVAVGRLDADADLDIVVANGMSNNVGILLNRGDGTFFSGGSFATGNGPWSLAIADLNGDSALDLAVGLRYADAVSVMLNDGNAVFSAPTLYPAGDDTWGIDVGDLDGDLQLDVAVVNRLGNSVSVLVGRGDGSFESQITYASGSSQPSSIELGDLDEDGDTDMVVSSSGMVSVFANRCRTPAPEEPVWPLANGSHDVLHSFQDPFATYFHEGVDLRGSLIDVVAVRGGTVRYVNQGDSGGTLVVGAASGSESDSYLHVLLDPWNVGDSIQAGDRVGRISDTYFDTEIQDHLHVNRFDGWPGGDGYVPGGTNMLHPLALFPADADRDPQLAIAAPADANLDGRTFHVAPVGEPWTALPYAFGSVELLLEATDRQTSTLSWNQGVVGVGYWIEALSGGDDVASALLPYRLVRFDDAWRGSSSDCDALMSTVMLIRDDYRVARGLDDTGWDSYATYRLTHTAGFDGTASGVSATQAWRTDARVGTGSANGTGGEPAREIQEARFQDGRHRVHALAEDLIWSRDTQFDVVVDNFRPYVRSFRVRKAVNMVEIFRSEWTFDPATSQLTLQRSYPAGNNYALLVGDTLLLEVEFSEPMAEAQLVSIQPALGALSALTSSQGPHERTRWTASLAITQVPRRTFEARVHLTGEDLAGTTLFPFSSDAPRTAPFNKRVNATPMENPTEDSAHGIPIRRGIGRSTPLATH